MTTTDRLALDERVTTHQTGNPLKGWDATDKTLIEAVDPGLKRIAIVGERWGALTVGLSGRGKIDALNDDQRAETRALSTRSPVATVVLDSAAGRYALAANLVHCGLPPLPAVLLADVADAPNAPNAPGAQDRPSNDAAWRWPSDHDGIVLRAPQSVALLRWQLGRLHELAAAGTPVWLGAPANAWSVGHGRALRAAFGPDARTRGVGKVRLCSFRLTEAPPPMETAMTAAWRSVDGPTAFSLCSLPGVFSHGRIDPGARALLAALPARISGQIVVDLGCGNGLLGVEAAARGAAEVYFTDDSLRALAAARQTWVMAAAAHGNSVTAKAHFVHADAGAGLPSQQADLVLCNPPFHQGRAQTRHIVDAMLLASRRLLRRGGTVLMVGNRHLHHETRATGVLSGVRVVHDDGRFSVLRGRR